MDKLLKNSAPKGVGGARQAEALLDLIGSIIPYYTPYVKLIIVRLVRPNPAEFQQFELCFRGYSWGRSSSPVQ